MKRKLLQVLVVAFIVQCLYVGVAGAQYAQNQDKTIAINTGLGLKLPVNTGALTFGLQESVHNLLGSTTGLEIDHYYYWVDVDGNSVVGIDPAKAMY